MRLVVLQTFVISINLSCVWLFVNKWIMLISRNFFKLLYKFKIKAVVINMVPIVKNVFNVFSNKYFIFIQLLLFK